MTIKLGSIVTCPKCGFASQERMPTNFCLIEYQCKQCGYVMTPKKGDCCIFCSYGSVQCPSVQEMNIKNSETTGADQNQQ